MLSGSIRMGIARTCCLWIIICLSGTAFGIDSSYIESIEADVAEFTTNEFNPPADSSWLGNKDSETTKQMDLNGFSDHLQDKSPGSFIFFEKLSNEYKQRLLKDYLATGDLERVKQDIFKYTRAMKK